MSGILDGEIRSLFGEAFGSFYLDATLIRVSYTTGAGGDGVETTASEPVKVQQDSVSDVARAQAGYSQNERRFLILQSGVTGPITGNCKLVFEGATYLLSSPEQDPARSYWAVRGVLV